MKNKKRNLWIIISVLVVFFAASAILGYYFYFFFYLKPSFEKGQFNKIIQSTGGEIKPGNEITYTIDYKNTGNLTVFEFLIKTEIPDNTEFVSTDIAADFNKSDNTLLFRIGDLEKNEGGRVSFSVNVKTPLDNGTVIKSNEVVYEYTVRGEKNFYRIEKILENTVVSSPDFSEFIISAVDLNGKRLSTGDDVAFKITLKNTGDMNAENVKVINKIPEKLILYTDSINPEAEVDSSQQQITWNIAEFPVNKIKTFTFKAKAGSDFENLEKFKNTAQVQYEGQVKNEISVEREVYGFPDFSQSTNTVADVNGESVWAGDVLKYTFVIKNSGLRPGENFSLYCPIPKGTSFLSGSENPHEGAEYDSENNVLVWKIEDLEVGEEKTFTFESKISSSLIKGAKIASAFYIEGDGQFFELELASISVRSYVFTTVVCMGDSQILVSNWPAVLDYLLESTYPRAEFTVIGSGVAQQMAYQGVRRFDSTVAGYGPQVVVFGYGTNDIGNPGGTAELWNGINDLINKAKGIGATPIVHSIGWIDTVKHESKKGIFSYNNALRDVCAANGVPYVDIYGPMSDDPGKYVGPDGMHWTADGGSLVAYLVFNTIVNYLDQEGSRK
ncbi:MAG: hypothetical protein FJW56_01515 [Actinobacteria bacterium]|nr:hypothetical protein [Actinomycetota bacterium]